MAYILHNPHYARRRLERSGMRKAGKAALAACPARDRRGQPEARDRRGPCAVTLL